MEKKNERAYKLRCRELELQERKQTLEEKKFDLEHLERKKRLEIEENRSNREIVIFENQQRLLEIIIKKINS